MTPLGASDMICGRCASMRTLTAQPVLAVRHQMPTALRPAVMCLCTLLHTPTQGDIKNIARLAYVENLCVETSTRSPSLPTATCDIHILQAAHQQEAFFSVQTSKPVFDVTHRQLQHARLCESSFKCILAGCRTGCQHVEDRPAEQSSFGVQLTVQSGLSTT